MNNTLDAMMAYDSVGISLLTDAGFQTVINKLDEEMLGCHNVLESSYDEELEDYLDDISLDGDYADDLSPNFLDMAADDIYDVLDDPLPLSTGEMIDIVSGMN